MTDKTKHNVKFFLGARYMDRSDLFKVLVRCFFLTYRDAMQTIRDNPEGVWIICKPKQFVAFQILRNKFGIKNEFIDLQVSFVERSNDQGDTDILMEKAKEIADKLRHNTLCSVPKLRSSDVYTILNIAKRMEDRKRSCNKPKVLDFSKRDCNPAMQVGV